MAATKRKATRSATKPKSSARQRVARPGDNTLEGKAQPYLKRIENLLDDLDSKRGSYMAECKIVREDIKEIYGEAKDHGVAVKALKALVEYRRLEKRQANLAADFDLDEQAAYQQLVSTLGPLGFAAAQRAGYLPTEINDTETNNDERADEAQLARVGRGHEPTETVTETDGDGSEPPAVTH